MPAGTMQMLVETSVNVHREKARILQGQLQMPCPNCTYFGAFLKGKS